MAKAAGPSTQGKTGLTPPSFIYYSFADQFNSQEEEVVKRKGQG